MFTKLAIKYKLPRKAFPIADTVDSAQSREVTIVLLDITVTDQLGFLDYEKMACIRAEHIMFCRQEY